MQYLLPRTVPSERVSDNYNSLPLHALRFTRTRISIQRFGQNYRDDIPFLPPLFSFACCAFLPFALHFCAATQFLRRIFDVLMKLVR